MCVILRHPFDFGFSGTIRGRSSFGSPFLPFGSGSGFFGFELLSGGFEEEGVDGVAEFEFDPEVVFEFEFEFDPFPETVVLAFLSLDT